MYETPGSCRICDFVVYNSRASQDTSEPACRCPPNWGPGPMYRHDTSSCSPRRSERSRTHQQPQLSGPGKLWRPPHGVFGGRSSSRFSSALPLLMASNGIRQIIPSNSIRVPGQQTHPPNLGSQGAEVAGALLALVSLAANRRKRKLSSRPGCRLLFFLVRL